MDRPILKLDEDTVNRIAAGEVVQRPSAAVKEMLENSLDAGSTAITVTMRGGGLQLMQIQDNGHGIRREDLGIVCERFTTSKLRTFDDLKKIDTFGFRGEALASITHVAHVTITTKTANSQCAYKAKYSDGKIMPHKTGGKAEPQPCAGMVGTTITVEDLFYNMNTRKLAFKNISEQYQRVMDVVGKYSIHYGDQKVAFTCKKHGQNVADIHTPQSSSTKENIKLVYGSAIFKELIEFGFDVTDKNATGVDAKENEGENSGGSVKEAQEGGLSVAIKGYVTNANYSSKKGVCILFINHRLVECSAIKRVTDSVYAELLPRHAHPFVYLDVTMPAAHVDVNVHPTKKEVHFLHETELLEKLHVELSEKLKSANQSRTFYLQTQLPTSFTPKEDWSQGSDTDNANIGAIEGQGSKKEDEGEDVSGTAFIGSQSNSSSSGEKRGRAEVTGSKRQPASSSSSSGPAPSKMVRVDPTLRKIDTMLPRLETNSSSTSSFTSRALVSSSSAPDGANEPPLLLCGECGTENSIEQMILASTMQAAPRQAPGGHFPGNCDCCGSANLVVRVPAMPVAAYGGSGGGPIADGRGRVWNPTMADFEETSVGYDSVHTLLSRSRRGKTDRDSSDPARNFSFVGVLDSRFTAVQLDTKLLLLDHSRVSYYLFYQLCLRRFACAPKITLTHPVPVLSFIRAALDLPEAQWDAKQDRSKDEIASAATSVLVEHAEMLSEYFRVGISTASADSGENGEKVASVFDSDAQRAMLVHLPALLDGYIPLTTALPMFLLRLATDTQWDSELECFDSVGAAIATFYSALDDTTITSTSTSTSASDASGRKYVPGLKPAPSLAALVERLLFPAVKTLLFSPREMFADDTVVQVASLDQLYKVFERC